MGFLILKNVMEKELKIMTATVSIQLITVDGKKMTKAVFNQIQREYCFDTDFNFTGDNFLGYVIDSGSKHLLYVKNGELRCCRLDNIEEISYFQLHENEEYSFSIIREYSNNLLIPNLLHVKRKPTENEIATCNKRAKQAQSFLNKLVNNQLYIAI